MLLWHFQCLQIILVGILFVSLCIPIVKNYRASVNSNVPCFPDNATLPSGERSRFPHLFYLWHRWFRALQNSQHARVRLTATALFLFLDYISFDHRTRSFGLSKARVWISPILCFSALWVTVYSNLDGVTVAWTPKIPLTMKTEKQKLTITPKLTITEYAYPFPQSRNTPP